MFSRLAVVSLLLAFTAPHAFAEDAADDVPLCACDATPAACDSACACDLECAVDWSADECAASGAGCLPNAAEPDDAAIEADEIASPEATDPVEWSTATAEVVCSEGATLQDGHCVADPSALQASEVTGGCTSDKTPGLVLGCAVIALVIFARRRRALLAIAIASCSIDGITWDSAVDSGPTGDTTTYVDIYSADLAEGAQYVLANQPVASTAQQPVAQFSLMRSGGGQPLLRTSGACGDRLVAAAAPGAELLGWARSAPGDGTAELVELAAPSGCAFEYETDLEAIDALVAQGYKVLGSIGYVWPPGMSDAPAIDPPIEEPVTSLAAPAPCHVTKSSAAILLYASPGKNESLRFLIGCPGEVIIGEKRETGPRGAMTDPAARAAGGRSGFVLDRNGDKLRALLNRPNGIERTAAYLRHKLKIGYDYIVIDEITAAPDWRDGTSLNRKLRKLMLRVPPRTVIPYISIDLTQYPNGLNDLKARRLLLRNFKRYARTIALEVYMHTAQVLGGAAPNTFRRAADRLALAVKGLAGTPGINRRATTTIGTSMHSTFPQYRYLDQPSNDLASITRQVNAIRNGGKRLRSQHGIGFYFVNKSDMAPPSAYSYDRLIRRMRLQALRFK
jgi:hypothetical protein